MDNGRPIYTQSNNNSPFFTEGDGTNDVEFNSENKEENLDLSSNETWSKQPDIDYQKIGNISSSPNPESRNDGIQDESGEQLGQITPMMPPKQEDANASESLELTGFNPDIFARNNIMTGDSLTKKAINELENLANTDNPAQLYDEVVAAREAFQGKGQK